MLEKFKYIDFKLNEIKEKISLLNDNILNEKIILINKKFNIIDFKLEEKINNIEFIICESSSRPIPKVGLEIFDINLNIPLFSDGKNYYDIQGNKR